ncbi:hypothetical protein GYMLUDRAFT_64407 [Collybiopsis luxurians FD-317 M1]|uniref:Uncharacterized protein n=1 Tax=Collybiopsis luxurians FD-317 M1 TaxID=944289 RepID=A0A0D0BCK8_9AGAR|nr:hypothetical protein GYMLUDRAFT_64407 [Collybiopsis luxurians FD-317 M1]
MQAAGALLHTYLPTSNEEPPNEGTLEIDSSPLKTKSKKHAVHSSSHPSPLSKCTQTYTPHKDLHPDHEIAMEAEQVITYPFIAKSTPLPSNFKDIPLGICSIICDCLNTSIQPWGAVKSRVDDEWNNTIQKQIVPCSWCDKAGIGCRVPAHKVQCEDCLKHASAKRNVISQMLFSSVKLIDALSFPPLSFTALYPDSQSTLVIPPLWIPVAGLSSAPIPSYSQPSFPPSTPITEPPQPVACVVFPNPLPSSQAVNHASPVQFAVPTIIKIGPPHGVQSLPLEPSSL